MNNFKNIHIGELIKNRVLELKMDMDRLSKFFDLSEKEITNMYDTESMDSEMLLKWSKILSYDFFRIYSQHLILYSPAQGKPSDLPSEKLPMFRKNIYTKEMIDFIVNKVESGKKTTTQIITDYNIPKTTLYKWIAKYRKENPTT